MRHTSPLTLFFVLLSTAAPILTSTSAMANEPSAQDQDPRNIQIEFQPLEAMKVRKGMKLAFPENQAPIVRKVRVYGHVYECGAEYYADTLYGQGIAQGNSHVIEGNENRRFLHRPDMYHAESSDLDIGWVYRIGFSENNLFSTNASVVFTCRISVKDELGSSLGAPPVTARVLVDAFPEVAFYLRSDLN